MKIRLTSKNLLLCFFTIIISCPAISQLTSTDTAKVLPPRYNPAKKVIEYGWNYPNVTSLLSNMNTLGQRPFQGLVFRPFWPEYSPGFSQSIFYSNPVSEAFMQYNTLSNINWATSLTDNFMHFWVAGFVYAGWFNDTQWLVVDTNLSRISKALNFANAKGIFFDTEHYGSDIWKYNTTLYPTHTLAQVQAKVKQRGFEFMKSLSLHKPDVKVLATGLWMFPAWETGGNINNIQTSDYCLLKSFADGMLEAATGQVKIIDGNEVSYYWLNTINFHYAPGVYELVSGARGFVDPALNLKNDSFKQVGQSVYYEKFKPVSKLVNQRRLEHNIYNTLLTSDEYVWFYSEENAAWWTTPFPGAADSAIRSGYNKYIQAQPLGFTISNDTIVTYSNDLQIISPLQNQHFYLGDTISFKVQSNSGVNNINYYTSYNKLTNIIAVPALKKSIALYPGTYIVYAYSNGYLKLSNPVTYYVDPAPSGISQIINTAGVTVYPDPAAQKINFRFAGSSISSCLVSIYDLTGKLILSGQQTSGELSIDITTLNNGIYIYKALLKTDGRKEIIKTGKFVVDQ
jgi:hypothetical protein